MNRLMWCVWGVTVALLFMVCGCALDDKSRSREDIPAPRTLSSSSPTSSNSANAWVGFYKTGSSLCRTPKTLKSCATKFHDCLRVQGAKGNYVVELYSVQANQHTCALSLKMTSETRGLKYVDQEGREIILERQGSKLVFSTNQFDPSPGFCGAHGSIDGIAFPLASRQSQDEVCFLDE